MHDEEAAGDLALRVRALAVCYWRLTDVSPEESAKRAETLKPDFEAHISHAKLVVTEQLFRFFDTALDQVLVRRLVECFSKQPEEVITRKTSLL